MSSNNNRNSYGLWGGSKNAASTPNLSYINQNNFNEFSSSSVTIASMTGSLTQAQGSGEASAASINSSSSSFQQRRKRSESIGGAKNTTTTGNITRIIKKGSSNFLKKFVKSFDDKDAPPTPIIPTDNASSISSPPLTTRSTTMPELPTLSSPLFAESRLGPLDTPPQLSPLLDQELADRFSSMNNPWPPQGLSQQQSLGLNVESWFKDTDADEASVTSESNGFSVAGLRDSLTLISRGPGLMDRRRSDEANNPGNHIGVCDDDEDDEDEDEDEDMSTNISNRLSRLYESGSIHMNQSQTSLYYSTKSDLSDSDAAELASRRASLAQDALGYSLGLTRGSSIRFSQYSLGSLHLAPLTASTSTPNTPALATRNGMEFPDGRATPRRPVSMFIPLSSAMDLDDGEKSEGAKEADHFEELTDAEATPRNMSLTGTASSSTSTLRSMGGNRESRSSAIRPITICVGPNDANMLHSPSSSGLAAHLTPESPPINRFDESPESAIRIAKKCYDEDESFLKRDEIAEYLGTPKPFRRLVLTHYMDYFEFLGMRLDVAFRSLCQKLILKGETQEVDRILEVFAERYVICNPRTLLGGADHAKDVVHAITYSILLLNTDLHIVQQSTKMSRSAFVKNTLQAVQVQAQQSSQNQSRSEAPESSVGMLRSMTGESPMGSKGRTPSVKSWKSGQSQQSTGGIVGYPPSHSGKMGSDAKANGGYGNGKWWTQELESLLKDMYSAVKHNQILLPASPATMSPPRSRSNASILSPPNSPMTSGFGSSIFSSNRMSRLIYPSSSSSHQQDSGGGFGLGSGRRNSVNLRSKQLRSDAIQRLNALAQSQSLMENDHHPASAPSSTSSNSYIRHSIAGSLLNEWSAVDLPSIKELNRAPASSREMSFMRSGGDHSQHSSSSRLSSMTLTASQTTMSTSTSMTTPSTSQNSLVSIQSHVTCLPADLQQSNISVHSLQIPQTFGQLQKGQLHQQHIQSRYRMEGILWRKHLLERSDKKAAHRAWRQLLVVVDIDQGTLSMFRSNGKIPKPASSSNGQQQQTLPTSLPSLGDCETDVPLFDEIPLQHTITNILPPPGYSSSRQHVFAVQLFTGAVYLFQAPGPRECESWARTCNYWAARTSKEPLVGGVFNMDYGWGRTLEALIRQEEETQQCISAQGSEQALSVAGNGAIDGTNTGDGLKYAMDFLANQPPEHFGSGGGFDPSKTRSSSIRSGTRGSVSSGSGVAIGSGTGVSGDNVMLFEWTEPLPTMHVSALSEDDQMLSLRKYVAGLEADMEVHQEHRGPMSRLFPSKSSNHSKAFSNWERRSRHLLKEMVKYQIYVECLEQSIQFQQQTQMELDKALQEQQLEYQLRQFDQQQSPQDLNHLDHQHQQLQQHQYYQRADGDLEAELAELVVHEKPV
ncbi:hypothetical protein BGX27_001697 [Mortierella sp. AM989]|nr:hypothetical protein BGX27_001697 [Mortierella sp. AM989]